MVVRLGTGERRVAHRRIWVGSDGVFGDAALSHYCDNHRVGFDILDSILGRHRHVAAHWIRSAPAINAKQRIEVYSVP